MSNLLNWSWKKVSLVAGILVLTVLGFASWSWLNPPVIPQNVVRQADFTIFLPKGNGYSINRKDVKYVTSAGILTLSVKTDGYSIVLTQQATPGAFAASPSLLFTGFSSLKNEKTISTTLGSAYVGNNPHNNQQMLAISSQGTLLLAQPSQNLSPAQWRLFFDATTPIKP